MEEQKHNNAAGDNAEHKNIKNPSTDPGGVQKKLRIRKLLFRTTFFVVLLGIAQYFQSDPHKLLCLLAAFIFGYFALRLELRNHNATHKNATAYSLLVFVTASCISGYAVLWDKRPITSAKPNHVSKSAVEMFADDFPKMLAAENALTSPFTNTIRFKLCFDFNSKSEVAAAYVSHSPDTLEICRSLVLDIPPLMSNIHANAKGMGGSILDTSSIAFSNFVFTGVVFIYCDDFVSTEQAGDLVRIYRQNGFTLQLRDGRYAASRNIFENR